MNSRRRVRVVLSPEAELVYAELASSDTKAARMLFRAIEQKAERIRMNPHYGNPLGKHLIPAAYQKRYGIGNLFRIELPLFWRMLYTLAGDDDGIVALILDILDHRQYDRKLSYQRR